MTFSLLPSHTQTLQPLHSMFRGNGRLRGQASVSRYLRSSFCARLCVFSCMCMCQYMCACTHERVSLCASVRVFEFMWRGGGYLFSLFSMRGQCVESITIPSIHSSNNMDIIYMVMQASWLPRVTQWTSLTVDSMGVLQHPNAMYNRGRTHRHTLGLPSNREACFN